MTGSSLPEVRVTLFGEAAVIGPRGGVQLSPYQLALVAIVFASRSVTRKEIIRLLWREGPSSPARHRVRQLVHAINQKVGAKLFEAERDMLRPAPRASSDVDDIRKYQESREFEAAALIVHQPFLPTIRDAVSDEFGDWCGRIHRQLKDSLESGARVAWSTAAQDQSWPVAREAAEALYVLDPSGDDAVESVIEARARVGRLRAAEVAYAEHLERRGRTGASPGATAAIERARRAMPEQVHDPATARAPFVGREEHLAQLAAIAREVHGGASRYMLIVGEAGIGKTRLLDEAARLARLDGVRVLRSRALELERRITLNPILDALTSIDLDGHLDALGEPWRAVIGATLPSGSLSEPVLAPPPIDEKSLSRRLMDAFSLLFEGMAYEQPTMLFIDDLHWADETTLAVLHFFRRRWAEVPFGLVATVRRPRPGTVDPLGKWVGGEEARPVSQLELEELTGDQSRELLTHIAGRELEEGTTIQLLGLAADHPLYLTEIGRDFVAGRLSLPSSAVGELTLPVSLREILSTRWEHCSDEAIEVAQMLSVASRPMRVSELGRVVARSLDVVVDAVEELIERRLCESDRDRVWISHDLFRASIYTDLGGVRQAMMHGQFAEFLATREDVESVGEVGIHFDRAGERSKATLYARRAGERAMLQGAVAEAGHFYELVSRNADDPALVAEATANYATAYHLGRDMHRANAALELASSRLRDIGDPALARRMDVRRVEGLAEVEGTPVEELLARLDRIKEESRGAEDWEAVALALDAGLRLALLNERFEVVQRTCEECRTLIDVGDSATRGIAHRCLAMGLAPTDPVAAWRSADLALSLTAGARHEERLPALNRALILLHQRGSLLRPESAPLVSEAASLARASGDLLQHFSFEANQGVAYLDAGDLDRAEVHFSTAEQLLGRADMSFSRVNLACNRGGLALERGDLDLAEEHFRSVPTTKGAAAPRYASDVITAGLGLCAIERGALARARQLEEQMRPQPTIWYYDPFLIVAFRARLAERRGDRQAAIAQLAAAIEDLQGHLGTSALKLRLLLARTALKAREPWAPGLALEGVAACEAACFPARAAQFRRIAQAPSS